MAETVQDGLFDIDPITRPATDPVSADRRRTLRQANLLTLGHHPLQPIAGRLLLHPDAAPATDREAPGLRCGGCQFRELVHGGAHAYPKCMITDSTPTAVYHPRASASVATDVRAWWPACTDYEPREQA